MWIETSLLILALEIAQPRLGDQGHLGRNGGPKKGHKGRNLRDFLQFVLSAAKGTKTNF